MDWLELVLRPSVLPLLIPIVAIAAGTAVKITQLVIAHRERMARLELGWDPDQLAARTSEAEVCERR